MRKDSFRVWILAAALGALVLLALLSSSYLAPNPQPHIAADLTDSPSETEELELARRDKMNIFKMATSDLSSLKQSEYLLLGADIGSTPGWENKFLSLEAQLELNFPLIELQWPWSENVSTHYRESLHKEVDLGSIPVINWTYHLTQGESANSFYEKINTGAFDHLILSMVGEVAALKSPVYLAFHTNERFQKDKPADALNAEAYIEAWKKVHDMFNGAGANNVIWIWIPERAVSNSAEAFPGTQVADVIGANWLFFPEGTSTAMNDDEEGLCSLASHLHLPVFIMDLGSRGTEAEKCSFISLKLHKLTHRLPCIKGLIFANSASDDRFGEPINWQIDQLKGCVDAIQTAHRSWSPEVILQ